jgi:ABC-type nitrate/sulfonate/bicarbonate transport system permease component
MRHWRRFALENLVRLVTIVLVIVFWWLATRSADSLFFPTPGKIFASVWDEWIVNFGDAWSENFAPSLKRLLLGYVLAAVLSIALGVAIGRSRKLSEYVEPIIHFVRAIPPPALLPLFIILLGIGDTQKVALIATGVFPPILLNTIDGVRSVDPQLLDTARVFQVSRPRRITHVVLPAAAPKIFAGLRIAMSIAVILMVISELVASTNGLGFRILQEQSRFKYVELWAGFVVLSAVGVLLNALLTVVERRVLRWRNA